jgi:amidophosphoribosyltransferase
MAATGYAAESGIPYELGLIRNHYIGRTFIEPDQTIRDFGARLKYNPVHERWRGSGSFSSTIPSFGVRPCARSSR